MKKVVNISILMLVSILLAVAQIAVATPVQFVENKEVRDGIFTYQIDRYQMMPEGSTYPVEFLIVSRCVVCQWQLPLDSLVFLGPGDTMLGEYVYMYPFGNSTAKKILDGKIGEIYGGHIPSELAKEFEYNVGVIIIDKVRSSTVPAGLPDYSFTKDWDLEAYTDDFEDVLNFAVNKTRARKVLNIGHSRGAEIMDAFTDRVNAQNLAYTYFGVVSIDMTGEYDPASPAYQNSLTTLTAMNQHMQAGNYVSDISMLLDVIDLGQNFPDYLSPIPGMESFTNRQVLVWMLDNTGSLPGPLTPVTGLPDSWNLDAYSTAKDQNLTDLRYTNLSWIFDVRNHGGFYPIVPLSLEKQGMEKRTHGGADGSGFKIEYKKWKHDLSRVSIMGERGIGKYPDEYTQENLLKGLGYHLLAIRANQGHLDVLTSN